MTLAMLYQHPGESILLAADVLLSGPTSARPFLPPTREGPHEVRHESGLQPLHLIQKLAFLGPYAVLAWSGNRLQARALVRHLGPALSSGPRELQDVMNLLERFNPKDHDKLEAFLTVVASGGQVATFSVETYPYQIGLVENLWCVGTGRSAFQNFLEWSAADLRPHGARGIFDVLTFFGRSLCAQAHSGFGLDDLWGGGFQVAVPGPYGFERLDRVLVRGWVVEGTGEAVRVRRGPFFYQFYEGQTLWVCRMYGADGGAFVAAEPADGPRRARSFPFGSHAPLWTVDVVHGEGVETSRVLGPLRSPLIVRLWEDGFLVTNQDGAQGQIEAELRKHLREQM